MIKEVLLLLWLSNFLENALGGRKCGAKFR